MSPRLVLALAAVAVLAPAAPALAQTEPPPGITTTADAGVSAKQDIAHFSFSVTAVKPRPSIAQGLASRRTRRIVSAVRRLGVAPTDVVTRDVSLTRFRTRIGRHKRLVTRYRALQTLDVTVRQISQAGPVVDAAARAGASGISGPEFDVSNRDDLYAQALRLALQRARAKAQVLADEAGLTLGRPTRIVEGGVEEFGSTGRENAAAAPVPAAPTPIRPGLEQVTASVSVTFATS